MKRDVMQLTVAAALVVAGVASWTMAGRTAQSAANTARVMTLQDQTDYWHGRYDTVSVAADSADPASLLISANAAFRKAQRDSAGAPAVEQLDRALQSYASALRNGGPAQSMRDAAYNFEFVARLRDSATKTTRRAAKTQPAAGAKTLDDLPVGPTIHGRPGTHPPDTKGEEFEVITPMDYGEREAQPEPTPGRPLRRKG